MIEVELPDGTIVEFPEGTSPDVMKQALARQFGKAEQAQGPSILENIWGQGEADTPGEKAGQYIGDLTDSFVAGVGRGAAGLMDLPGAAFEFGANKIMDGVQGVTGKGPFTDAMRSSLTDKSPLNGGNAIGAARALTGGAVDHRGDTAGEKIAGTVGEFLPGGAIAKAPMVAGVIPGVASELAGMATEGVKVPEGVPLIGGKSIEPAARMAAAIGSSVAAGGAANARQTAKSRSDYIKNAPPSDNLREGAKELYQKASSRGVVAEPGQMKMLKAQMDSLAKKSGFVTPKGNIAKTGENVRPFLKSLDDYTGGPIAVDDLQSLRSQIQLIAESPTPKVSRLGVQMLKAHDKFTDKLAPELKQANALYTRAMRGDMMDQVDDLADVRASQLTQSGRENALRTEFRALDRKVAKGKIKGLRPDQASAIEDVSRGTAASNTARNIGKMAPTGVVSAMGSGAVPFMVGNAMGSPALGSALAAGSMGTGMIGRGVATRLQERAAEYASAAMRSGTPMEVIKKELGGGLAAVAAIQAAKERQQSGAQ